MSKILAIDLDGTLFYPKKRIKMIPKNNLEFLHEFIDSGNKVVLCTGRSVDYIEKVKRKINREIDAIGCNSAFIITNNKLIAEKLLDNQIISKLVDELEARFQIRCWMMISYDHSLVIAGNLNIFLKNMYKLIYWSYGTYAERYVISNEVFRNELKHGKVYKLMMFFGLSNKRRQMACEANEYIRKNYANKIESSWADACVELTAVGVSKSNGLLSYLEYNHISHQDVYVVGDSGNDISMFNSFNEHSFCMKHSSSKVKKFAKYEIKHVADIKKYLKEN